MNSLRLRLLAVLGATILAAWAVWFALLHQQMARQQIGHWDGMLRNIAEQILLSLPDDIGRSGMRRRLQLDQVPASGKLDAIHFQVWLPAERRSVVASSRAPAQPLAAEFSEGYSDARIDGEPWRVFAVSDASGQVQVQVGQETRVVQAEILTWLWRSLSAALLVAAGLAVVLWVALWRSLRPLREVQEAMARRDALDFAALPVAGMPSELRPLIGGFNALLERLERSLRNEREFLGEAAHELRTPLAALLTQAQVAQHSRSEAQTREALERLVSGIDRTSRLAQQLLDSARIDRARAAHDLGPVPLADVVRVVAREFELATQRRGQQLRFDLDEAVVHGNLDDLGILVRNLLDNALRYGEEHGQVEVECRRERERVLLRVSDDGPGVPAAERERVFERFVRGSNGGNGERGSGLGLSLVARIAAAHGARWRAGEGLRGRGFGVELEFPAAPSAVRSDTPWPAEDS